MGAVDTTQQKRPWRQRKAPYISPGYDYRCRRNGRLSALPANRHGQPHHPTSQARIYAINTATAAAATENAVGVERGTPWTANVAVCYSISRGRDCRDHRGSRGHGRDPPLQPLRHHRRPFCGDMLVLAREKTIKTRRPSLNKTQPEDPGPSFVDFLFGICRRIKNFSWSWPCAAGR